MRLDVRADPVARPRRDGEPRPDVEFYRIAHRAMEREAGEVAALAGRLARGAPYSRRQARGLRRYIRVLLGDLQRHHRAEDEVGWGIIAASAPVQATSDGPPGPGPPSAGPPSAEPPSAEPPSAEPRNPQPPSPEPRGPDAARALAALVDDHDMLRPVMAALEEAAQRLSTDPGDQPARESLAAAGRRLDGMLRRHIADEEAVIFPLISEHVSVADFARWEKAADRDIPLRDLPVLLPSTIRVVDPADRARVTGKAPIAFRLALALCGGHFERTHRLVFSATAPTPETSGLGEDGVRQT
jgi:hypothetical protein